MVQEEAIGCSVPYMLLAQKHTFRHGWLLLQGNTPSLLPPATQTAEAAGTDCSKDKIQALGSPFFNPNLPVFGAVQAHHASVAI